MGLYSEEIITQARETILYTFLSSHGIKTQKANYDRYNVIDIPGLVIYNNVYFYFYDDSWGNSIDFLVNFYNYNFREAVYVLTGQQSSNDSLSFSSSRKIIKAASLISYETPKLTPHHERVYSYLYYTRRINRGVILSFLNNKLVVQTKEYGNCLFPWYENKEIVGAEIIGTLDQKRFKKIQPGSKGGYGFNFCHPKSTRIDKLRFFESAIDLMSFISLYKIEINTLYISMAGLKPSKIEYFSKTYNSAHIILNIDADEAAKNFIKDLVTFFEFSVELPPVDYKDYNQLLKSLKG
jgi:hypothetical protein